MTTANKLTVSRLLIIPVMLIVIYLDALKQTTSLFGLTVGQLLFAFLFVLASLTDLLDGYIARKYNQITTFGKFLDPIADKVLVFIALLHLMVLAPERVPLWAVMVVIIREFVVTGVRLIAVDQGAVIAASSLGKIKTATTMLALILMLFNDFGLKPWIANVIFYIAAFFTLLSGLDYVLKNKKIIFENM
ncbi:MAG: CDP-diacylglycerol--glycerol-3-phosphate 3-phosphatidyltransferase [Acholeplasmataceae bacterium]|nr:CDP-diacylglycerol--glycerol-3-phosphate 3-phosphatidyltransferase [Acholeplasmataceae bacterium]